MSQHASTGNVDNQTDNHPNASRAKRPVPTPNGIESHRRQKPFEAFTLGEVAGSQRSEHCTDVDSHVKNREATVTPCIVHSIETPTMALMFGLSKPVPTAIRTIPR